MKEYHEIIRTGGLNIGRTAAQKAALLEAARLGLTTAPTPGVRTARGELIIGWRGRDELRRRAEARERGPSLCSRREVQRFSTSLLRASLEQEASNRASKYPIWPGVAFIVTTDARCYIARCEVVMSVLAERGVRWLVLEASR